MKKIRVELKLFASLRKFRCRTNEQVNVEIPTGATVRQLLESIGVPPGEAPVTLVNGIRVEHHHILADGDCVSAFPLVGGG